MERIPHNLSQEERKNQAEIATKDALKQAELLKKEAGLLEKGADGGGTYEVGPDGALAFMFSEGMRNEMTERAHTAVSESSEQAPLSAENKEDARSNSERWQSAIDVLRQNGREDLAELFGNNPGAGWSKSREGEYLTYEKRMADYLTLVPDGDPEAVYRSVLVPAFECGIFHIVFTINAMLKAFFNKETATDGPVSEAIATLREVFDTRIQAICAWSKEKCEVEYAVPELGKAIDKSTVSVRYGVSESLKNIPEIRDAVMRAAEDPNWDSDTSVIPVELYMAGLTNHVTGRKFPSTVNCFNFAEWR
jgi:hypothetical protein